MRVIENYDDFLYLINCVKNEFSPVITNCYLQEEEIERLINQSRLSYVKQKGILFLFEDNVYYRNLYYYWNIRYKPDLKLDDSLCAVPRVYYADKDDDKYLFANEMLSEIGFMKKNTMRQTIDDIEVEYESLNSIVDLAEKMLNGLELYVEPATRDNAESIRLLLSKGTMLPVYQIPFMTNDEYQQIGDTGGFFCVKNRDGEIVAASGVPLNKPSCSFVAIEDAYKVKAGIAPVLSYKICEYCRKMGYKKIRNWIDVNNKESIEYHNMIGAKWGNRYLEYLVYEV